MVLEDQKEKSFITTKPKQPTGAYFYFIMEVNNEFN